MVGHPDRGPPRLCGRSGHRLYPGGFAHTLNGFFSGLGSSGATLAVALYVYAKEPGPGRREAAFAIAAILLLLTLGIDLLAALVKGHFQRRRL